MLYPTAAQIGYLLEDFIHGTLNAINEQVDVKT